MKFFGYVYQEWLGDEDFEDDEAFALQRAQFDAAVSDYQNHLDALPNFPEELRRIAQPFLMYTALFVRVLYEPANARLKLVLRCGDIPGGYFDLVLNYDRVEISPHDLGELARATRGAKTGRRYWHDAYCHELDMLPDGKIEHSFLFYGSMKWLGTDEWEKVPPAMFTIRCTSLTWERIERPDRKLPRLKDRFRVV